MAFPKKKKKTESAILKHMREMREKEWDEIMGKKRRSPYSTQKEKDEMKRLKKKYGIKEKREQKDSE